MSPISVIPLIQGHIDVFAAARDGGTQLRGWIFRADTPITRIDIALQGQRWLEGVLLDARPDVLAAFEPHVGPRPHISQSGFDVTAPLPAGVTAGPDTIVTITPYTPDGRSLAALHTYLRVGVEVVEPPAELRQRVGGAQNFSLIGSQLVGLILTCVQNHKTLAETHHILDWGCGCGRVIRPLLRFVAAEKIDGCDIDAAAIHWDKDNIPGPTFTRIEPYPPTPYPDSYFDLVYGISVMTHLDEKTQLQWLEELRRITAPGAIIALSVIGENLRATNMPASLAEEFAAKGFAAFVPGYSAEHTEFSHRDYYQEAYHTVSYIAETWSRYFDVLQYVETKHQDVVILRRA